MTRREHVNATVRDCIATAAALSGLFGWHIRWQGRPKDKGWTVHLGTDNDQQALFAPADAALPRTDPGQALSGLSHTGLVVNDLDAIAVRIRGAGYVTENHADYEPGRRI